MDTMVIPSDMFGSPEGRFGPQKRLGNELSRLSQLQGAR
jgi:branched-chain amino acid transport system substrate-binding protein